MRDFGVVLNEPVRHNVGSTACMDAVGRRGVGQMRHTATCALWIQRAVAERRRLLEKWSHEPCRCRNKSLGSDSDGLMEPQQ